MSRPQFDKSALALPAYQDDSARAKVAALNLAASGARDSVAEKSPSNPSNTACAGGGVKILFVEKIATATVQDGGTVVVTGAATSPSTDNNLDVHR